MRLKQKRISNIARSAWNWYKEIMHIDVQRRKTLVPTSSTPCCKPKGKIGEEAPNDGEPEITPKPIMLPTNGECKMATNSSATHALDAIPTATKYYIDRCKKIQDHGCHKILSNVKNKNRFQFIQSKVQEFHHHKRHTQFIDKFLQISKKPEYQKLEWRNMREKRKKGTLMHTISSTRIALHKKHTQFQLTIPN